MQDNGLGECVGIGVKLNCFLVGYISIVALPTCIIGNKFNLGFWEFVTIRIRFRTEFRVSKFPSPSTQKYKDREAFHKSNTKHRYFLFFQGSKHISSFGCGFWLMTNPK